MVQSPRTARASKLGKIPVTEIDQNDIRDVLAPIWHTKAETARKAIDRLGICLKHCAALGLDVDLQATAKAIALVGRKCHKPEDTPALDWREMPGFYASLSDGTPAHLTLRLVILTAMRPGPVRHMHLDQIDDDVWTVSGEGMKGRRDATPDFRMPLSTEALSVLEQVKRLARNGFMFPSVRKGVMSDATMSRLMERRGMDARPHGFRSSLRTWLAEATEVPHDIAETCLGHTVGSAVDRAYRRTDYLEQSRVIMERWASHVTGQNGAVVKLTAASG